jgi:hypothetical protein
VTIEPWVVIGLEAVAFIVGAAIGWEWNRLSTALLIRSLISQRDALRQRCREATEEWEVESMYRRALNATRERQEKTDEKIEG